MTLIGGEGLIKVQNRSLLYIMFQLNDLDTGFTLFRSLWSSNINDYAIVVFYYLYLKYCIDMTNKLIDQTFFTATMV